jgi:hypothetical protein
MKKYNWYYLILQALNRRVRAQLVLRAESLEELAGEDGAAAAALVLEVDVDPLPAPHVAHAFGPRVELGRSVLAPQMTVGEQSERHRR